MFCDVFSRFGARVHVQVADDIFDDLLELWPTNCEINSLNDAASGLSI